MTMLPETAGLSGDGVRASSGLVATGTADSTIPETVDETGAGAPVIRAFQRAIANSKSAYEIMTL